MNSGLQLLLLVHFHSGQSRASVASWTGTLVEQHYQGWVRYFGYQVVTYLNLTLTVCLDFKCKRLKLMEEINYFELFYGKDKSEFITL